jgi:hypothetical protein
MLARSFHLILPVLFTAAPLPAAVPADAPADPLKGLKQDQALAVVVAALKARDTKLSNLSYGLHERVTNVVAGRVEPMGDIVVEFRRHPAGHWMHLARHDPRAAAPYHERWMNWKDGKATWLTREARDGNAPVACVGPTEGSEFRSRWFNLLIGFRATDDDLPRPLAQWIEDRARGPRPAVACARAEHLGTPAVRVTVGEGSVQKWTFYFDPARDWMMTGCDFFGGTPQSNSWSTTDVRQARRAGGVWLPTEAFCRSGLSDELKGTTQTQYTVPVIGLGDVTEADLAVPFPAGTTVDDLLRGTRYRVEPDGTKTPLPKE